MYGLRRINSLSLIAGRSVHTVRKTQMSYDVEQFTHIFSFCYLYSISHFTVKTVTISTSSLAPAP